MAATLQSLSKLIEDHSNENLSRYFSEIGKYKQLEPAELARLVTLAQKGDREAKEKVVLHNLLLVAHYAKEAQTNRCEVADLISEGNFGLMRAVMSFDPNKGAFSTYASQWIKKFIFEYKSKDSHTPNNHFTLVELKADDGTDITESTLYNIEDEDSAFRTTYFLERSESDSRAHQLLSCLTDNERYAVCARLGLDNGFSRTFECIADEMGYTGTRVSQLFRSAIAKMRKQVLLRQAA